MGGGERRPAKKASIESLWLEERDGWAKKASTESLCVELKLNGVLMDKIVLRIM